MLPHPFARQEFRRGYVAGVSYESLQDWELGPKNLDELTPIQFVDAPPLPTEPQFEQLIRWRIGGLSMNRSALQLLTMNRSRLWPQLQMLTTESVGNLRYLLQHATCPALTDLRMTEFTNYDATRNTFFEWTHLPRFKRLELTLQRPMDFQRRWHARECRLLFDSVELRQLEHLSFNGQAIGDGGLLAIVRHGALPNLAELHLEGNEIGATGTSGVEALLDGKVPNLKVLNLAGNALGLASVRELAVWPGLWTLRYLNLAGCQIPATGIRRLLDSPYMHAGLWLVHDADLA